MIKITLDSRGKDFHPISEFLIVGWHHGSMTHIG